MSKPYDYLVRLAAFIKNVSALPPSAVTGRAVRALLFIGNKTLGFQKDSEYISGAQAQREAGMAPAKFNEDVHFLKKTGLIDFEEGRGCKGTNRYWVVEDYEKWPVNIPTGGNIPADGNIPTDGVQNIPADGNTHSLLPNNSLHTKTHIVVFDRWNSKSNLTKCRKADTIISPLNGRLKEYSEQEILEAIDNYSAILESEDHYFTYTWTLQLFLTRKNALPMFVSDAKPGTNFLKDKQPKSKPTWNDPDR